MKISTKGRYGLRVMIDVALCGAGTVKTADIASRRNIPRKYAEQIIGILVKGGLLKSVRGAMGGYALVKPAEDYTAGEILRVLEGGFSPDTDPDEGPCLQNFWQGLYAAVNGYLDGISLQQLAGGESSGDFYQI